MSDKKYKPLSIAILGTRGIPARYGGFETFAEELSTRLASKGYSMTVYGRRSFGTKSASDASYREVRLIATPTILHKYMETPVHALMSFFDLFRRRFDVVLLCNAANSPFAWLVRLRGLPLAINLDGIERHRGKWNVLGRWWYRLGEVCSVLFANKLVADAGVIADYYRETYRRDTEVIPYGASAVKLPAGKTLARLGVKPGNFVLYVSRLEPENNALGVIEAFNRLSSDMPLVLVGDAPYAKDYIDRLRSAAGKQVIFAGYQFGEAYQELRSHCYAYVQATEVGGTHPALVEAMAYGNCIIANDVSEHREVLGDAGLYYPKNDFAALGDKLREVLQNPDLVKRYGEQAVRRAAEKYSWDEIVLKYEKLFAEMAGS